MPTFIHPKIGKVAGNEVDKCSQFLGIKYATLQHRFAAAEPVQYSQDGLDATKYGPQVVSPPAAVDMELGLIQHTLPKPEFPGVSDVDGLSLNITVPGNMESIVDLHDLPVLVFLHGGGFKIGGNWWPQYDMAKFVALSVDLGKPLIAININYRLGAPGFLTSLELRAAGCPTNNGLRDQRAALRWIKEYIGGFSGDATNITVLGESAGAVSTGYLLLSEETFAKRIICLGGCPPLLGQLPIEVADDVAKSVMSAVGLEDVPPSDVVQSLLDVPIEAFWSSIPPSVPMIPVIDGDIIPDQVTLKSFSQVSASISGKHHIESVMMGYSELDGSIMAYVGLLDRKVGIASSFRASAAKTLANHPDTLKRLLEHYGLDEQAATTLTDDEAFLSILRLITDAAFFAPAIEIVSNFVKDSFLLSFNEPNPWDGLFKGHASHILDVSFLFQNFNQYLDETQRASAVAFATDIITYVNGQMPWKPFNSSANGYTFYKDGKRGFVQHDGQTPFILEVGRDETGPGMDLLMQVAIDFITG